MSDSVELGDLPNIDPKSLIPIDVDLLAGSGASRHPPRILILYGSLRPRSFSRFVSEGMLWVSPERHGAMTSIMKAQVDWIPLSLGGVRPSQEQSQTSHRFPKHSMSLTSMGE